MIRILLDNTPPSTQHIYRHNGNHSYMTKEGVDAKEIYKWQMKSQYKEQPIVTDMSIIIELFFKDKRKRDLDNFNKLILDAGTGILWRDDDQIQELVIRKFIDKHNPRVELHIM